MMASTAFMPKGIGDVFLRGVVHRGGVWASTAFMPKGIGDINDASTLRSPLPGLNGLHAERHW